MTLLELKNIFQIDLSSLYRKSEIAELFSIIIQEVTGLEKFEQRSKLSHDLSENDHKTLKNILQELKSGKPYQQILGKTEFYGLTFFVNENVLIPRPETEELLELAISTIKVHFESNNTLKILDIGTGSGIIPIVLKKHFPDAEISALDLSSEALKVAEKNAQFHAAEITFKEVDYLNCKLNEVYDVIISNPPYIGQTEENEIANSVKGFEPTMALFSPTPNALVFYEKIAADCKNHLAPNGLVFLEINQKLGAETLLLFSEVLKEAELIKDLSGNDRFVMGRK